MELKSKSQVRRIRTQIGEGEMVSDTEYHRDVNELEQENAILKAKVKVLESELDDATHVITQLRAWVNVLEKK